MHRAFREPPRKGDDKSAAIWYNKELYEKNLDTVGRYFEDNIFSEMNTELVDFLLKVSVVDDFTEELAVMLTGNSVLVQQTG